MDFFWNQWNTHEHLHNVYSAIMMTCAIGGKQLLLIREMGPS